MSMSIPFEVDAEHRRCVVGGEPMIFHCHHYNTFLQRSIQDAEYIDSIPFLMGAGAEVAFHQLSQMFKKQAISDIATRKRLAQEIYRWAGFGTIDLAKLSDKGGSVATPNSHYAFAWRAKWKSAFDPVCHFASGWLAGAAAAIFDKPAGSFNTRHETCSAVEPTTQCVFELSAGKADYPVFSSVGLGMLSTKHNLRPVPPNSVDYDGILNAVSGLPLFGNEQGLIPAFGVYLTRHYANYYNRISFEFERALTAQFGAEGRQVAEPLLVEAGHVCAFNTFGGIMTSTEWDALIRPSLKNDEDWVHGIVAVVNALGWGRWQVTKVSSKEAEFVLHDDYESAGYLGMYGKADHNVSYLAQGGVAGIMNLVYLGRIMDKPELTPHFYDRLFKQQGAYKATAMQSRAMGDDITSFRVARG
jgi:hypothetical protein